jgi:hypothetical protein
MSPGLAMQTPQCHPPWPHNPRNVSRPGHTSLVMSPGSATHILQCPPAWPRKPPNVPGLGQASPVMSPARPHLCITPPPFLCLFRVDPVKNKLSYFSLCANVKCLGKRDSWPSRVSHEYMRHTSSNSINSFVSRCFSFLAFKLLQTV